MDPDPVLHQPERFGRKLALQDASIVERDQRFEPLGRSHEYAAARYYGNYLNNAVKITRSENMLSRIATNILASIFIILRLVLERRPPNN